MARILVATAEGVHDLAGGPVEWPNHDVTCLRHGRGERWAVLDGREVVRESVAATMSTLIDDDLEIRCLWPFVSGAYVGTAEARLFMVEDHGVSRVRSFDEAEGRAGWYTPWGGPPDVRSIATTTVGDVLVNVHVGGILRLAAPSHDDDRWEPTIDVDADVHEVVCGPGSVVLAAAAAGLCVSVDDGRSWYVETAGLHATYSRAVCVSIDQIIVSVSDGPSGTRSALYRRQAGGAAELHKCAGGLPEWFDANIDTGWLAALGRHVAFATADGDVWVSEDTGSSWRRAATSLPPPRAVVVV